MDQATATEQTEQAVAPLRDELDRLTNLYVATSRLHESLDRGEVLRAIQEIIINLLGSEELAVFELSEDGSALELVDSFGVEEKKFKRISMTGSQIGKVAQSGQSVEGKEGLTACVPLMLGDHAVGAVAVFSLLPQKKADGLQQTDRELLELLRAQAGLALYCTRLVKKRAENP